MRFDTTAFSGCSRSTPFGPVKTVKRPTRGSAMIALPGSSQDQVLVDLAGSS